LTTHIDGGAPSIGKSLFAALRWLMIGLLVSLGALLIVAGAVARHIWLRRAKLHSKPWKGGGKSNDPADDTDPEFEP
jgi:hypothetical protein